MIELTELTYEEELLEEFLYEFDNLIPEDDVQ